MFAFGCIVLVLTGLWNLFLNQWARSAGSGALGLLPFFIALPFMYTIGLTVCVCSFF